MKSIMEKCIADLLNVSKKFKIAKFNVKYLREQNRLEITKVGLFSRKQKDAIERVLDRYGMSMLIGKIIACRRGGRSGQVAIGRRRSCQ